MDEGSLSGLVDPGARLPLREGTQGRQTVRLEAISCLGRFMKHPKIFSLFMGYCKIIETVLAWKAFLS